jgi:hypothetical protein
LVGAGCFGGLSLLKEGGVIFIDCCCKMRSLMRTRYYVRLCGQVQPNLLIFLIVLKFILFLKMSFLFGFNTVGWKPLP